MDPIKYFRDYGVMFHKNNLDLYEVKNGSIIIPNITLNDSIDMQTSKPEVYTTELSVGDMMSLETLTYFAEILDARIDEAKRFKNIMVKPE